MKRTLAALALVCSTVGGVGRAHAHGGLPVSQHILRQNDGDIMFVPVVFWGVWVGQAGGPWKWICEELINGYRFRKFALSSDGAFYATDVKGVTRSTDNGCTWTKVGGTLATLHTTDVVVDPTDGATAYAATGDGGSVLPDGGIVPAANGVYVTHDHGASWTALPTLSSDLLFQSVRVAPSNSLRIYVTSGAQQSPYTPTLHRSLDGGATFTALPLANLVDGVGPHALELLAVDPRDPAIVWARAVAVVPTGADAVTRQALLRSTDGGATFTELLKLDAVTEGSGQTRGIDGIAWDVTAGAVYVATRTGLYKGADAGSATAPSLAAVGGLAQTQCVDVHKGAVYACSSQFPPDNAAVARSSDGAASFTAVLNYVDTVGPVDCPAGTPVGDQCPAYWYMYGAQLGISFDGGVGGDMTATPTSPGGCGCTVGRVEGAVGGLFFAALLMTLAVRTGARSGARARRRG